MASTRTAKARHASWIAAALFAGTALASTPASAEPVSATGKGVTGGALLGAEIAMIPQAIIGVDKWWAYAIGGGVGAVAGGVGGYFVETQVSTAEPSLYMLAGGMALVIPTVVLTLNATAYKPEVEEGEVASDESTSEVSSEPSSESSSEAAPGEAPPGVGPAAAPPGVSPPSGAPPAGPGAPGPQSRRHKSVKPRRLPATPGLLDLDFTGSRVAIAPGVPTVDVRPILSARDVAAMGAPAGTQVTFPVVGGRF